MVRQRADLDVFHAVADPTRRAILDRLRVGRAAVNALAAGFALTRPAISKHLRVLRSAALVNERREGRLRVYELQAAPLRDLTAWVDTYRVFWQHNQAGLKKHVESKAKS
jgi:DNA-binding transcriptional ArsR family regulator